MDQDATIIESHKQQALRTYEGERGYQPMLAVCHPVDEDLSLGTPASTPATKTCRRGPRLAVIAHNVLTALKRIALPKRLRFLIINTAGRLVQHARKTLLRLAALADRIALWKEAMRLLPIAP